MASFSVRDLKSIDIERLNHELSTLDLSDFPLLKTNESAQKFHEHLLLTYNDFAPPKILSKKKIKKLD